MQLEAVLWWQNHFGKKLYVYPFRLRDKHAAANHFCLQAFISD